MAKREPIMFDLEMNASSEAGFCAGLASEQHDALDEAVERIGVARLKEIANAIAASSYPTGS